MDPLCALKKNQAEAHEKDSKLVAHWQSQMASIYGGFQKKLTRKEAGQLKLLYRDLGIQTLDVVNWALKNWGKFALEAKKSAGLTAYPNAPQPGFLLVHYGVAVNLMQSIATAEKMKLAASIERAKAQEEQEARYKAYVEANKPFIPTPEQLTKIMAALDDVSPDALSKVFAEIEN